MGIDLWNHSKFLHHKVRNMTRRGWLLKTYNDKKILRGRVKTGEKIENDFLDIIHPVGYVAHVEPTDKTEILTMDIAGDTSRRVILNVMGDREYHPQPDENEAYFYAPGDKKLFTRVKKERKQQGGGGGGGGGGGSGRAAGGGQQDGQTKESGRVTGIHVEGKDQKVSSTTTNSYSNNADDGAGHSTKKNFQVTAGGNTQMQAGQHVRKGTQVREGTEYVGGLIHARDHIAGGDASVSATSSQIEPLAANEVPSDKAVPAPSDWGTNKKEGTVSLLATAAGLAQSIMQQQQDKGETDQKIEQAKDEITLLKARVAALEQLVAQLGGG